MFFVLESAQRESNKKEEEERNDFARNDSTVCSLQMASGRGLLFQRNYGLDSISCRVLKLYTESSATPCTTFFFFFTAFVYRLFSSFPHNGLDGKSFGRLWPSCVKVLHH